MEVGGFLEACSGSEEAFLGGVARGGFWMLWELGILFFKGREFILGLGRNSLYFMSFGGVLLCRDPYFEEYFIN